MHVMLMSRLSVSVLMVPLIYVFRLRVIMRLMNQLNTLQKETLEGLFSGEYTVSKEVNDVY